MIPCLLALASPAWAGPVAYTGAQIHVGDGTVIEDGTLLVDNGVIYGVGPREEVVLPNDTEIRLMKDRVIIPGLVDTHSHIASTGDLNESTGPLQPALSAIDALDPTHPSIQRAQAGGITTANVMPGSGNLMGGQTAYLKLREADTIDAMLLCDDRRTEICGGMKMANGTNSRRGEGGYPSTRMASALQQRQLFADAQKYAAEHAQPQKGRKKGKNADSEAGGPGDLRMDPLVQILDGDRIVHFHTHRADDIVTAMEMADEFGFEVVLHHVSEAWKVVDPIVAHGVPVSLILIDSPGGKEEAVEIRAENAALLEQAGVLVSLHTDDPITDSRLFLRSGGMAIRAGMSEEGALSALTLNGAKQLGLDDRLGSLAVGKDADFVVLDGPPFSVWTHVLQTFVEGEPVFWRKYPEDLRHATGGSEVADRYPRPAEGAR